MGSLFGNEKEEVLHDRRNSENSTTPISNISSSNMNSSVSRNIISSISPLSNTPSDIISSVPNNMISNVSSSNNVQKKNLEISGILSDLNVASPEKSIQKSKKKTKKNSKKKN